MEFSGGDRGVTVVGPLADSPVQAVVDVLGHDVAAVVGHLHQPVTVTVLEVVLRAAAERIVVRDAVAGQVAVGVPGRGLAVGARGRFSCQKTRAAGTQSLTVSRPPDWVQSCRCYLLNTLVRRVGLISQLFMACLRQPMVHGLHVKQDNPRTLPTKCFLDIAEDPPSRRIVHRASILPSTAKNAHAHCWRITHQAL